jgi:2-polyprenyl-6-methoxyphenol hydroxylase-like FAD-dependent oxidoreductase
MRGGVMQLHRWGLLPELLAAGTPPVRRTLFHYAGDEPVQVSIRSSNGVDALYAPRRTVLDRLLVEAAAAAGAEVRHGVAVTGLLTDSGRVTGVRGATRDGRSFEVHGRVVVGADGIRSVVAEQAGATVVRQGRAAGFVLYRYYSDLPAAGYEWCYADQAAAGLIPTNHGEVCVFVAAAPARVRALRSGGVEAAFETLLATAAPSQWHRVAQASPSGRMHGFAGVPGFVRRAGGPGWALVGDAGYFKDPITTHGLTDALRDAELLSESLLATWAGAVPETTALATYQSTRDALSRRLFDVTEEIAGYDWEMSRLPTLLRQVSASMTDEVEMLAGLSADTLAPSRA